MTSTLLPSTVKVGPFFYTVAIDDAKVDRQSVADGCDYGGYSDHQLHEVFLRANVSDMSRRETLVHEVVHCVIACVGFSHRLHLDAKVTNEEITQAVSPTWLGVLRENPALLAYLTEVD